MAAKNEPVANVAAEQPKKKNNLLKIIIIIILVIVLLLGGFTAIAFFTKSFFFAPRETKITAEIKETMYPLETFIVNLDEKGSKKYLKISIVIGCVNKKDVKLISEKEMQIRDTIISTLREQGLDRLAPAGNEEQIKQSLNKAINTLYDPDLDIKLYFTEYIIQ
ncbi:MAG: flagellar basal body-associated FliL family protein [Clostridiales bacterium]|nr:flagellar basal body-associated FliL family protein [Clostridiales bacterium]